MTRQVLIDNIFRQTTILIAQLATSGGEHSQFGSRTRSLLSRRQGWAGAEMMRRSSRRNLEKGKRSLEPTELKILRAF
jgi:hypothetical protein